MVSNAFFLFKNIERCLGGIARSLVRWVFFVSRVKPKSSFCRNIVFTKVCNMFFLTNDRLGGCLTTVLKM